MREKQIETKLVMVVRDVGGSSAEKIFSVFFFLLKILQKPELQPLQEAHIPGLQEFLSHRPKKAEQRTLQMSEV